MQYKKITSGYLLKLEEGEEIIKSLESFVKAQQIKGALITGIGTAADPELGFFNRGNKEYTKKKFAGDYEVVSLNGNVSYFEENPVIHIHTTISGDDFLSYSGHLFSGKTAATIEIFLLTIDQALIRKYDKTQNLNLLSLK